MASAGAIRAGRAFVELFADDSRLQAGLKRAQGRLKAFADGARAIGTAMSAIGAAGATAIGYSAKTFAEFSQSMARVSALSGATGRSFAALEQTARMLGETTVFSASQAAQAMQFFALAGYDVQRILKSIGPTLNLAAAGQLDVAQAADIAAKIMAGMGIASDKLGGAVDILTKAMTTANTDLMQLGDAMKFVGPIAKNAGVAFEEVVAAVQLLSNAGIQGEMAGTTLRGAILSLTSPSAEAKSKLDELGVAVVDSAGNMRSLAAIIRDLNRAMGGMGSGEKLGVLGQIFNARQAAGVAELLSQGADRLEQFTDALKDAGGTAERIARTQLNTLAGDFTILTSALEGLKISIGEAFGPTLRSAIQSLTGFTAAASNWVKEHKALTVAVGGSVLAIGGLGASLLALSVTATATVKILGTVPPVLKAIQAALAFTAGEAGILATAFGALRTATIATGTVLGAFLTAPIAATVTTWTFALRGLSAGFAAVQAAAVATVPAIHGAWAAIAASAGPVTAVVAVVAAVAGLATALAKTTVYTARLHDELSNARAAGDEERRQDQAKFERLAALSKNLTLSNTQMAEARQLAGELQDKYGDLGITFNDSMQSVDLASNSFGRLAEAMQQVVDIQLKQEMYEARENIQELNKEIANVNERIKFKWSELWGSGAAEEERVAEIQELQRRRDAEWEKIQNALKRQRAMRGGDQESLTGMPGASALPGASPAAESLAPPAATYTEDWARKVHQLRLGMIADEQQRELALINERYDHELDLARQGGASRVQLSNIDQARALELAAVERKYAEQRFNSEQQLAEQFYTLQARQIEDEHERELALIDIRSRYAIDAAVREGDVRRAELLAGLRDAEIENELARQRVRQREQEARIGQADDTRRQSIAELELRSKYKGIELERRLLELRRAAALEAARSAGENLALVETEFDLRRRMLDAQTEVERRVSVFGTFNPAALSRLGGGRGEQQRAREVATLESIARDMRILRRRAEQNGLVFGADN